MEKSSNSNCGIGITGVITAVLIALKISGIIQCTWWFALMPLLIGIGIKLLILLLAVFYVKWLDRRW